MEIFISSLSIETNFMEAKKILQADVLDILFEGRNKEYGAYALRRTYDRRLYYALAGTAMTCLLFIVANIFASSKTTDGKMLFVSDPVILQNIPEKVHPVKPPEPKIEKPPVAMAKVTIPKIVPDKLADPKDQPPTNESLENINIGNENRIGENIETTPPLLEQGTSKTQLPIKEEPEPEGTVIVQLEAQFPGGAAAWSRFLEQNLNSEIPVDNAAPAGRYTVFVSFVVDKDGSISEVTALNDPGFGTAAEAVRVIKKSRQWTPALQNGRNVTYRQKQSITFEVSEN